MLSMIIKLMVDYQRHSSQYREILIIITTTTVVRVVIRNCEMEFRISAHPLPFLSAPPPPKPHTNNHNHQSFQIQLEEFVE